MTAAATAGESHARRIALRDLRAARRRPRVRFGLTRLERAALRLFARGEVPGTQRAIAERLGTSPARVHGLLLTLRSLGFLVGPAA